MEKLTIYHLDHNGAFVGVGEADADPLSPGQFLIPAGACTVPVPADCPAGKERRYDAVSQVWYLADLPPPPVEPVPPTAAEIRAAEIRGRLPQIDADSVRPLRAVANGVAVQFDKDKLSALDAEAAALRAELAALVI